jgi:hypothetical protein
VSAAARLLGLWVRIPQVAWMSVSCECCVLSGRGLCDGPITRPDDSYRVWCVWSVISKPQWWGDLGPLGLSSHKKKESPTLNQNCITKIYLHNNKLEWKLERRCVFYFYLSFPQTNTLFKFVMEQGLTYKRNGCEQSLVMPDALRIKADYKTSCWMVKTIRHIREQWHSSSEMVIRWENARKSKKNLFEWFLGHYKSLMRLPRIQYHSPQ